MNDLFQAPSGPRKFLNLIGFGLAVTGLAFVGFRLWRHGAEIDQSLLSSGTWLTLTGSTLVYLLANLMLALVWWNLLQHFGTGLSIRWAIKTFGISNLAKYLPGNVFHYVGRQAMAMAGGVSAWVQAKSLMLEIILLLIGGAIFSLLTLPLFTTVIPISISSLSFASATILVSVLAWRFFGSAVVRSLCCCLVYLAVIALIFTLLIVTFEGSHAISEFRWIIICGGYVLAWLVGFITPGAPAGIGVRESVLVFLFQGELDQSNLLLAIILTRVVTVSGDVLTWAVSMLMKDG